MKRNYHPEIPISKNNHLYSVDESLVKFARKYMESLPSYEDANVERDNKSKKEKLLKKIS